MHVALHIHSTSTWRYPNRWLLRSGAVAGAHREGAAQAQPRRDGRRRLAPRAAAGQRDGPDAKPRRRGQQASASQSPRLLDSSAELGCAQVAAASAGPEENYQEIHTCHLYGVDEVMSAYQKTMRRNQVSPKPSKRRSPTEIDQKSHDLSGRSQERQADRPSQLVTQLEV